MHFDWVTMRVVVQDTVLRGTWLRRQIAKVLKVLAIREGTWEVHVVKDRAMMDLHKRTMNDGSTTDVLTFDLRDVRPKSRPDREGVPVELDTVICLDEARRRAKEFGHTTREELLLYCVH